VLLYYAIANAACITLPGSTRFIPYLGLAGCLLLAATLPWRSMAAGAAVVAAGAVWYMYIVRRVRRGA
jgi:basic amino acid/polyamine antiporter, APA family